jgi:hypothetical protein
VRKREEDEKKQEELLEELRIEYEEGQDYIRRLKKQEQSSFYFEAQLPPSLNPNDINEQSFPSLIKHIPVPPPPK